MTSLSVLTLVRNRQNHLDELVEGLRRSRTRPLELIIVDMSDAPVRVGDAGCRVHVERFDGAALPLAAARNRAASLASGEHLLFLDVDCIPSAELCGRLSQVLEAREAVVCPEVLYLGPDKARGAWSENDLQASGQPHPVRPFPQTGEALETNPGLFWSLAFALRRDTFFRLGGFDEAYVGYGAEDTDLGFRIAQAGVPLLFSSGPVAFHQHHEGFDPPLQHFRALVANARRFHLKWGIWPMDGWLRSMADTGLLEWGPHSLQILRDPTPDEILHARKPRSVPY